MLVTFRESLPSWMITHLNTSVWFLNSFEEQRCRFDCFSCPCIGCRYIPAVLNQLTDFTSSGKCTLLYILLLLLFISCTIVLRGLILAGTSVTYLMQYAIITMSTFSALQSFSNSKTDFLNIWLDDNKADKTLFINKPQHTVFNLKGLALPVRLLEPAKQLSVLMFALFLL